MVGAAVAVVGVLGCRPGDGKVAYVGATVWDGTGSPPIPGAVLLIDSDTIEVIGRESEMRVPRGAEIRRIDGKFVIPGLIDAHAHLERWMLNAFLAHGVTAVRDAGGDPDSIFTLRDEIALGTTLGPRVFAAGAGIDGTPPTFPTSEGVRSPVEARRAIDDRKLNAVSHAIVETKISRNVLRALLDEANVLEVPVGAHLGRVDAVTAARAGVASIEHLSGVVESTVSDPSTYFRAHSNYYTGWKLFLRGWAGLDSAALDRTARTLAQTGVVMVPTLFNQITFANLQNRNFTDELDLSSVPADIVTRWGIPALLRSAGITSTDFAAFRLGLPNQALFVRRFLAAGGIIAAGSNAPFPLLGPGESLHEEMLALARAGLTPEQVLLASTRDAAALLRADSLGTLGPGHLADFVILNANPLDDIVNVRSIDGIVYRGVSYRLPDLPYP